MTSRASFGRGLASSAALGIGVLLWPSIAEAQAPSLAGYVSAESRTFLMAPSLSREPRATVSLAVQPELRWTWRDQSLLVVPFGRVDPFDSARTHADVRELVWERLFDSWEVRAGIGKVFWGVIESQHLVDVVNQTDFVENIDGEDKLGQPMINLTWLRPWGAFDVFVLPGFRQPTFPGVTGRLRLPLRVATELARFEAGSGPRHVDLAARWSFSSGDWDLGVSHFYGTARDPVLAPGVDRQGRPVLVPEYQLINQTGVDVQATKGRWLWKLEAVGRTAHGSAAFALAAGVEYTFANLHDSGVDIGVLGEYLYDDRGNQLTSVFDNDIFLGMRLSLNDAESTQVLVGAVIDRRTASSFVNVEASRRLRTAWTLSVETRLFAAIPQGDVFYAFRNDDYVQVEMRWYF